MTAQEIKLEGIVRAVRVGAEGAVATVALQVPAACPRCAEGRGCGAGLFTRRAVDGLLEVRCPDALAAVPGDPVRVAVGERYLLRAAALVYGMPLAGAAIACVTAWLADAGEGAAVLLSASGLAAGFLAARRRLRHDAGLAAALHIRP